MQFASPTFSLFSLARTPFIPLVALQNVDHLASRMDQLTSPTCKRGKFNDQVSTPCPTVSNSHSPFSTPGTNFPTFDEMKSNQLNHTPQFPTPHVPQAVNSHVSSSYIGNTWYSRPVVSPMYPKGMDGAQRFAPHAITPTNTSTCTQTQVKCKSESNESAKSDTHKATPLDPEKDGDYSSMFDQFNVKPKVRLYRRFTADQWACKVATTLQTPDLD